MTCSDVCSLDYVVSILDGDVVQDRFIVALSFLYEFFYITAEKYLISEADI